MMKNMDVLDVSRNGIDNKVLKSVGTEDSSTREITSAPVDKISGETSGVSSSSRSIHITERSLIQIMPVSRTPDEELEREMPLDDFLLDDEEEEKEDHYNGDETDEEDQQHQTNSFMCCLTPVGMINGLIFGKFISRIMSQQKEEEQSDGFQNSNDRDSQIDEESNQPHQNSSIAVDGDEETAVSNSYSDGVLSLYCYLTAKEMKEAGITWMPPFINQGRPDLKKKFLMMREEAMRQGEKRVAVCICAPKRLVQICKMACIKYSDSMVRFDFHSEVFD